MAPIHWVWCHLVLLALLFTAAEGNIHRANARRLSRREPSAASSPHSLPPPDSSDASLLSASQVPQPSSSLSPGSVKAPVRTSSDGISGGHKDSGYSSPSHDAAHQACERADSSQAYHKRGFSGAAPGHQGGRDETGSRSDVAPVGGDDDGDDDDDGEPPSSPASWLGLDWDGRLGAWVLGLGGACLVGLSGVLPILIIPENTGAHLQSPEGGRRLRFLLSFAVGGLLGDVFLHLLPETWQHGCTQGAGLWVTVGLLTFLVLEKVFPDVSEDEPPTTNGVASKGNGVDSREGNGTIGNGSAISNGQSKSASKMELSPTGKATSEHIKISGYLNLFANCVDNFTHGLAVAGSFLVSHKVGYLTTLAILLHEIPHEVGDFAILLRAGFDRWQAAKLQLITAFGGICGAVFTLTAQSAQGAGDSTAWILPFTAGGFLYIALVGVMPELLQEKNPWDSLWQLLFILCGIGVMAIVTIVAD